MWDAGAEFERQHGGPLVLMDNGHYAAPDGHTLIPSNGHFLFGYPRGEDDRLTRIGRYWEAMLDRASRDRDALAAALDGKGPNWDWPACELWVQKLYGVAPGGRPERDGRKLLATIAAVADRAAAKLAELGEPAAV